MVDVHRREAALVVMGIPERKLLTAMRRAEGVVDVEDLKPAGLHGGAKLVDEGRTQPRRLGLARCILETEMVDCEASAAPLSGQRPTTSFINGSWRSRSRSLASS